MHARDIMTAPAITATPQATILEVVTLMLENRISALPIVDEGGAVVGLVSEGDLIRRSETGARDYSSWWLAAVGGKVRLAEEFVKTHGMTAADVMTKDVVIVTADTPVWQIAETLEKNKIKRVPVISDGALVGVVSRANLLQALAAQREKLLESPSSDDRKIRDVLINTLDSAAWSDLSHLNIVVLDGVVHYWGIVRSDAERQALKVAAEEIAGVRDVVDHMHRSLTLV